MPEKVDLRRDTDPVIRYRLVPRSWPEGTKEAAAALDVRGLRVDVSHRDAWAALKGDHVRAAVRTAVDWRRQRVQIEEMTS